MCDNIVFAMSCCVECLCSLNRSSKLIPHSISRIIKTDTRSIESRFKSSWILVDSGVSSGKLFLKTSFNALIATDLISGFVNNAVSGFSSR